MDASKSSAASPLSSAGQVWACAAVLSLISAAAIAFVQWQGTALFYGDATAHLNIARRLTDGRTAGYESIGTVWLPLPHALMMPFAAVDGWWRNGLAGAIPAGMAWVLAGTFLFVALRRLFGVDGAIAGVGVFVVNFNLLYLQATPMTESIFFAASIGMLLFTLKPGGAVAAGVCCIAATLTRYEAWFLLPFVAAYYWWKEGRRAALVFCCVAGLGPLYWLLHNWYCYSDPLEFYRGAGSAKDIQKGLWYPGAHDWWMALRQFAVATKAVNGWPLIAVSLCGLLPMVVRRAGWPFVFCMLAPVFYVVNLHGGDSPMYIPEIYPFSHYNSRYALAALPLFAVCAGALAAEIPKLKFVLPVVALSWFAVAPAIVVNEGEVNSRPRRTWTREVAGLLREEYQPGTGILMPFGDLTGALQEAGIPLRETIHQDDKLEFDRATKRPDLFLDTAWVVAQRGDPAAKAMRKTRGYVCVKLISLEYAPVIEVWQRSSQIIQR